MNVTWMDVAIVVIVLVVIGIAALWQFMRVWGS